MVRDLFGVARVRFRRATLTAVTIKPRSSRAHAQCLLEQPNIGEQISLPSGRPEGDLTEMRPYVAGDTLKLVLWKLYTRSGQLLVRQPERALTVVRRSVLHLVCATDDDPVAEICRSVLEAHSFGSGLLFGTDLDEPPTTDAVCAMDQLVRSTSAVSCGGSGLAKTLAAGAQQGCSACVVFVPARPGPWLDDVVRALASHRGPRKLVVGVEQLVEHDSPAWKDWLLDSNAPKEGTNSELDETCRRLSESGAEVLVLAAASGAQRRAIDLMRIETTNLRKRARLGV